MLVREETREERQRQTERERERLHIHHSHTDIKLFSVKRKSERRKLPSWTDVLLQVVQMLRKQEVSKIIITCNELLCLLK